MRRILYFAFCAAFASLGSTYQSRGMDLKNTEPTVRGGGSHPCYRECVANDVRVCYYEFFLHEWSAMARQCGNCPTTKADCYNPGCITAGGKPRPVTLVNYMLPGPSIQVCKGDIIQVNLTNGLGSESTTIHWHGMGQTDTPYMDGVPYVTQCPILPGNTFLYNFTADPAGTHIWHSHAGFQDSEGFYGSLIIREPNDVNADFYDFDDPEHRMTIWHWHEGTTASELTLSTLRGRAPPSYSLTVNGYAAKVPYGQIYTPRANYTVTQGYRYRFRLIFNTAIYCPVQVSIDQHKLLIIATDGATVEPVEVDTFMMGAGERYDFVLSANQPPGNYWIRFRGLGLCSASNVTSQAILHYEGADDSDPSESTRYNDANRSGVLLNPANVAGTDYSNNTLIKVADLIDTMSDSQDVSGTPDYKIYKPLTFRTYPNYQVPGPYAQFNNMSFKFPPVPFLTQSEDLRSNMYCTQDDDSAKVCRNDFCTCPYVNEIKKDSLVEMIFIDTTSGGTADHPIHIHGHYFHVVASAFGNTSDITVESVKALDEAGLIERNLDSAPLKDVIAVPARGFVVVRVISDNPGYWLVHCHVSSHFEEGMGFVIKIGEHSQMVQAPEDFPTCSGDYSVTNPGRKATPSTPEPNCASPSNLSETLDEAEIEKSVPPEYFTITTTRKWNFDPSTL